MEKLFLDGLSLLKSIETRIFILDFVEQNEVVPNSHCLQEELSDLLKRGAIDCCSGQYSVSLYGKLLLDNDEISMQYQDLKMNVQGMFLLHFISKKRDLPDDETLNKEVKTLLDEKWILDNHSHGYYVTELGKRARRQYDEFKHDSEIQAQRNVRFR